MSVRPFSSNEISSLRDIIEKNGYNIKNQITNYFRYSLSNKEKVLIFTIKLPVELPLRLNVPFEIASFRVSIVMKLWNLTQNTFKIIIYLMKMLRDLRMQVSMEHNFPIEGLENNLNKLLNQFIPETIQNESENAWINRIRLFLFNKRDQFKEVENKNIEKIIETLTKAGLNPTFKIPFEIKKGIPKLKTSEVLLFSDEESEFFILEKGFFSFFKDIEYNKLFIRSSFDSYTPYLLELLFNDKDFNIDVYLENWIKFSRLLLNSIIEIIEGGAFDKHDFIRIKPEKYFDSNNFIERQNNFPFSALYYESNLSKELFSLQTELLDSPPIHFEIMENLNCVSEGEELIKNYKFQVASKILEDALKIYNKYRQKKIIIIILLRLRKIASLLNQDHIAINYLQNALQIAKSSEIPIEYILRIQYQLGKIYYKLKEYENSLKHFEILNNFLESEKDSIQKANYLGMSSLYIGLIYQDIDEVAKSKNSFKKAFQVGANKSEKVKLKYNLLRARYFKNKGDTSQTYKFLKTGFSDLKSINKEFINIIIEFFLEFAEFFIHYRKDTKKAYYFLDTIKPHLSEKTIPGIKRTLKWNLLISDYYKFLVKSENYLAYLKQVELLKNQLRTIGVQE